MNRPVRPAAEIFDKPVGIFDRLPEVRSDIGEIQIMSGAGIETFANDCPVLTAVDQRQYRNTAFGGASGKFCYRLQALRFGLADINHGDQRTGREEAASQIVESAGRMHPPAERCNFGGQWIALVERKQEQIPEFDRLPCRDSRFLDFKTP